MSEPTERYLAFSQIYEAANVIHSLYQKASGLVPQDGHDYGLKSFIDEIGRNASLLQYYSSRGMIDVHEFEIAKQKDTPVNDGDEAIG